SGASHIEAGPARTQQGLARRVLARRHKRGGAEAGRRPAEHHPSAVQRSQRAPGEPAPPTRLLQLLPKVLGHVMRNLQGAIAATVDWLFDADDLAAAEALIHGLLDGGVEALDHRATTSE
ncbi:MAG: hypothetical protein ACJAUC_002779, partial [Planctomycetota bacterium]